MPSMHMTDFKINYENHASYKVCPDAKHVIMIVVQVIFVFILARKVAKRVASEAI